MNTKIETQLEFDFMKSEQYNFNFAPFDPSVCYTTTESRALSLWNYYPNVTFYYKEKTVGKLDWSDGTMKFTGDADESAQLFFDGIIKRFVQMKLPFSDTTSWKS